MTPTNDGRTLQLEERKVKRSLETILKDRVSGALGMLDNPDPGLSWPWPNLTAATDTMCEGDLILIAAYTGSGKTTFLQNCQHYWARKEIKQMYFGTEQAVDALTLKAACMTIGVPFRDARRGRVKGVWLKRLKDAVRAQGQAPFNNITYYPEPEPTPDDLEKAIRYGAKQGIKVFIIDYLGRVKLPGEQPEWMEGKQLVVRLKNLAVKLKIRIIAAIQVNGNPNDKTQKFYPPDPDNFQWGKAPAREADQVIGVFQPIKKGIDEETITAFKRGEIDMSQIVEPHSGATVVIKFREDGVFVGGVCTFWVKNNLFTVRRKLDSRPPEAPKGGYRAYVRKGEMDADPAFGPVVFDDEEGDDE